MPRIHQGRIRYGGVGSAEGDDTNLDAGRYAGGLGRSWHLLLPVVLLPVSVFRRSFRTASQGGRAPSSVPADYATTAKYRGTSLANPRPGLWSISPEAGQMGEAKPCVLRDGRCMNTHCKRNITQCSSPLLCVCVDFSCGCDGPALGYLGFPLRDAWNRSMTTCFTTSRWHLFTTGGASGCVGLSHVFVALVPWCCSVSAA